MDHSGCISASGPPAQRLDPDHIRGHRTHHSHSGYFYEPLVGPLPSRGRTRSVTRRAPSPGPGRSGPVRESASGDAGGLSY